jgi:hypothetical protein
MRQSMKNAFAVKRFVSAFAVMALAGWLTATAFSAPPSPPAQDSKNYTASIDPVDADGGSILQYTFTITNDISSGNSAKLGATTITIPDGFTVDPNSLSVNASGGKDWSVSLSGNIITLLPHWISGDPNGDGNQRLDPTQSLTLTFNASAPCDIGDYGWITHAYQDTTLPSSTEFTLLYGYPTVHVDSGCDDPEFSWNIGDYCTYTQGGWGSKAHGGNVGSIRDANFTFVYPSGVAVGDDNSMTFSASSNVEAYLPAGGTPGALTGDLLNPTSTSSGVFGGQVLALRMNLDFNEAGILDSTLGDFGSVIVVNTSTSYDGSSISEVLAAAETALGGGEGDISILNSLVTLLNEAFDECAPTDWAQAHLAPVQ